MLDLGIVLEDYVSASSAGGPQAEQDHACTFRSTVGILWKYVACSQRYRTGWEDEKRRKVVP
jgi:hypothetical protein